MMRLDDNRKECAMQMLFHWGWTSGDCILFEQWQPDNFVDYMMTCMLLMVICIVREYLIYVMKYYEIRSLTGRHIPFWPSSKEMEESQIINSLMHPKGFISWRQPITLQFRIIDCLLYGISLLLGYGLMLAIMTFNIGILVTVVLSYMIGRFIFQRQTKLLSKYTTNQRDFKQFSYDSDHCHVRS